MMKTKERCKRIRICGPQKILTKEMLNMRAVIALAKETGLVLGLT